MSGLTLESVISRMWMGRPWTKSYSTCVERKVHFTVSISKHTSAVCVCVCVHVYVCVCVLSCVRVYAVN